MSEHFIYRDRLQAVVDWLLKDLPPGMQRSPSRGTLLRWEEERKDRETGAYAFDPSDISGSERKQRARFRELWLLELETDKADMEAGGNEGWPENFMAPRNPKTAVLKSLLCADGWTPLKGKLQSIRDLRR
jgi:hypothetical protein